MDQPLKFGFIPIEGGAYYPEFLEEVLLGKPLGFDSVWLKSITGCEIIHWVGEERAGGVCGAPNRDGK